MSQKGMLGTLPLSKVLGPVSSLVEALASEQGKEVLEELKKFNRKEHCWGPKPTDSDFLFIAGESSSVRLTKRFDPQKFYQTRKGLYVWSDFVDRIVSVAEPIEAGKKFQKTTFWELKKPTTGEKLRQTHTDDIWGASDFCAWLSTKLMKQPNGEEGDFLNTGYANLFLVEGSDHAVFVVYVAWYSDGREWRVDTWSLDNEWNAYHRFFSKPPIAL